MILQDWKIKDYLLMLEGSYAEQIIELVQIGDLSTFVLFPATVNISDEN